MDRVPYEGYVIEASPHQLADDSRWTLEIVIERHTGDGLVVRPYSASNTFASREEAVQHCINFGRQVIDGKVAGCTAP